MDDLNNTIKTYGACLLWIIGSGCVGFLIWYWIGANSSGFGGAFFGSAYQTEMAKADTALNSGFIGAAIFILAALVISGIIIGARLTPSPSSDAAAKSAISGWEYAVIVLVVILMLVATCGRFIMS